MNKYKLFAYNMDKEEAWINSYHNQGYHLTNVTYGCYRFAKGNSNDFKPLVKLDYRIFKNKVSFEDYKILFEDSGWHHIGGTKNSGTQYFIQMQPHASQDIFSDNQSKAERYKRIASTWFSIFVAYLPILVAFSLTGIMKTSNIFDWKSLYLTPGLWERTGFDFMRALLFETPFAIGRGFSGVIFLTLILCFAFFGLKALYWYKKEMNNNTDSYE